ncbi:hypothetical protein ACKVEX_16335 [Rhodocyclaceae bacterium SMB388]
MVALLILSHGSLALSSAISPSHDPLRATTHAHALAKAHADHDDHGHGHEVFEEDGGTHKHGHNPADHSHDKPNVPPSHAMRFLPLSNQWAANEHRLVYPAPCVCLERPPKGLPIV